MKKLLILPLVFFMFCGCAQKSTTTPILNNITFTAEISYGEHKYSGDVTVGNNVLNLAVTEPQEIKGLNIMCNQNSFESEFMGVTFTSDENTLPQNAAVKILYNVLTDTASEKIVPNNENGVIKGRIDSYKYVFTFSPTGLPISLVIDELDLQVKFSNVTLK